MLSPLRSRIYRHLFAAQVIALLGTGLATVALGLIAFQLAGAKAGAVLGTALAIKMIGIPKKHSCRRVLTNLERRAKSLGYVLQEAPAPA